MSDTINVSVKHERPRTKKNKQANKVNIWNAFDALNIDQSLTKPILECVYSETPNKNICDNCDGQLSLLDDGHLCCINPKCGIIYNDVIDQSPEWRFYGADDNQGADPSRCGMPINKNLEESSYGCMVSYNSKMSYQMRKTKKYIDWQSMPHKEKSQYEEFQYITTMAQIAGIPKIIIDDAISCHKKISDFNLSCRGVNRDGIIASSVYLACRMNNNPRTAKEIAHIFKLDKTSASKGCKSALLIIHNLENDTDTNVKTKFCKLTPGSFIERFCSKLNIIY